MMPPQVRQYGFMPMPGPPKGGLTDGLSAGISAIQPATPVPQTQAPMPMLKPDVAGPPAPPAASPFAGMGAGLSDLLNNPAAQMSLLGAGGALLGASGPTQVPTTMGDAMSGALQGGLGGYAMHDMMQRQAKRDKFLDKIMENEAGMAGVGTLSEGSGLAGLLGGLY